MADRPILPGEVRYDIDDRITALPAASPFPASDARRGRHRLIGTLFGTGLKVTGRAGLPARARAARRARW